MKWLSIDYILKLHEKMIQRTGGASGLRDIKLLQSAIYNAQTTFDGQELYPDIESKIGAICHGVINNHPFVDGNKRMGIISQLLWTNIFLVRRDLRRLEYKAGRRYAAKCVARFLSL